MRRDGSYRLILLCVVFGLIGCTNVSIPSYVQDKNPYKQTYYAEFDDVLQATETVLEELGWVIENKTDPSIYERDKTVNVPTALQKLLVTEVRQTSMFLGSRFARINVYIRTKSEHATEVEIRYVTVNSIPFKSFTSYNKDHTVKHIFKEIAEELS